ncbi:MAG: hypothetical protein IPL53_05070 [Ignavibacteria bacterium]|nr:hypothetical protein [Ignavibacteria bacterium]
MDYIKTRQRVKDHKVIIDIPDDFKSEEVDVIILPIDNEKNFTENIMKLSEDSFKEWDNEEDEIYNSL